MTTIELIQLTDYLASLPAENEFVEYMLGNHRPSVIGERISAISNSACLRGEPFGYLIYGIEDNSHKIIGTDFHAKTEKIGNEDMEMWLLKLLSPRLDLEVYDFEYADGMFVSLFKIPAAKDRPVTFQNTAYIRVNTNTRPLRDYPEKEAKIWRNVPQTSFESDIARRGILPEELSKYLSFEKYFDLMGINHPSSTGAALDRFESEHFIIKNGSTYDITNLGALLFAKNMSEFDSISRKKIRVITYEGKGKIETARDIFFDQGYALCLEDAIQWIIGQTKEEEVIGTARRSEKKTYPDRAIRELCTNAILHQDFYVGGFPTIEIFSDRIEFSNPGTPLIRKDRFIDESQSRNDNLADKLRRFNFCEEKGSGMDKAVYATEMYLLPAIDILIQENKTVISLFAKKDWNEIAKQDKLQACYQHACLKFVNRESMTNQSLRERFNISEKNSAIISRIIKEAIEEGLIKESDPDSTSRKFKRYIPYWA